MLLLTLTMVVNADFKASVSSTQASNGSQSQPVIPIYSKAAEASGTQQNHNIMATISDDDDRLLARIGYTPVRAFSSIIS